MTRGRPGWRGWAGDEPGSVVTTQSVFAGSYTVESTVVRGTPVIAVKALKR